MGRMILIAVAVLLLVWLVRRALGEARRREGKGTGRDTGQAPPSELVSCAHCGVLLPRAEAQGTDGAQYCSAEHARLGPRQP